MAHRQWENRADPQRETGTWRDRTDPLYNRASGGCQTSSMLSANTLFFR